MSQTYVKKTETWKKATKSDKLMKKSYKKLQTGVKKDKLVKKVTKSDKLVRKSHKLV